LAAGKSFVLYNGIDLDRFRPREPTGSIHGELGLPPSYRLVGGIGQLVMRKGLDVWLDCAAHIATRQPDVHFLIVGERNSQKDEARRFEDRLRERAEERPLRGRVHFLGLRWDVDRLLNELCILVHAARQEPLGRVLLEAGAAGTAVVATDVGGTSEIFPSHHSAALLVPPGDGAALARAAIDLLTDGSRRKNQSRAARRRMEQQFDVLDAGRQLVSHYESVRSGSH
jgi:glycosyltransferase involved in cell wall biosynthesis